MRWNYALHVIGVIIFCIGGCMLLPLGFGLYYQDSSVIPLIISMGITMATGLAFFLFFRKKGEISIGHREGMAIVALGWVAAGLFGAFPFYLSSSLPQFVDAFFESMSGFTTTGATVLTDIEAVPRGLLMWRSMTHWLGGMGIIVLSLAILPFLGVGGMQLYKAEVPGPVPDKLRPRIKDTALVLWKVYALFTVLEIILLLFGGMDLFESICHTFGTLATGGFSTKNASIGHYNSVYIDTVITVFMLIAGINFTLHYLALKGKPRTVWKDPEFRFFIGLYAVLTLVILASVYKDVYASLGKSLQYATFQVAAILTTTGYGTADYEIWPFLPQAILLFCMFVGGCAGSTAGGMKCMRIMLLLKQSYRELFRLIHPRSVSHLKLGGQIVKPEVLNGILGYFVLFLFLFILSSFALAAMGMDVLSSFAAVVACIGNIGPGLGSVGPTDNYAHIPYLGKWLLTLCMLLGRLEIYTVIILFVPEFWRK